MDAMFPTTIESKYRAVTTRYGEGDFEITIPLGSWRKGGGLAGKKGHVYVHGPGSAGIWLNGRSSRSKLEALRVDFPDLKVMQSGDGETTARLPISDLDRILPMLGAKRRFKASEAKLVACRKASAASPLIPGHGRHTTTRPKTS